MASSEPIWFVCSPVIVLLGGDLSVSFGVVIIVSGVTDRGQGSEPPPLAS